MIRCSRLRGRTNPEGAAQICPVLVKIDTIYAFLVFEKI